MRKSLIFPVAAAAGFLLACNMCGLGELIQKFREGIEEGGGGPTLVGREPDFEGFGLSLVLPEGWETIEYRPSEGPSEQEVTMGIFAHVDGLEATVTCIMDPEMFDRKTADEVARYMLYAPEVDHPSALREGRITLSGLRGYEATYVIDEAGEVFIYRYIAVASKRDSRVFTIEFDRYGSRRFTSADEREMKRFLDGIEID